jgi:hypothetical protein
MDWSMGLHWAVPALQYLMPEELFATIQRTQVDPNIPTSDADQIPFIDGQIGTGELIGEIKSDKFYHLRRDKFRGLSLEGLDVYWERLSRTSLILQMTGRLRQDSQMEPKTQAVCW